VRDDFVADPFHVAVEAHAAPTARAQNMLEAAYRERVVFRCPGGNGTIHMSNRDDRTDKHPSTGPPLVSKAGGLPFFTIAGQGGGGT
jgi:hypothetical protein